MFPSIKYTFNLILLYLSYSGEQGMSSDPCGPNDSVFRPFGPNKTPFGRNCQPRNAELYYHLVPILLNKWMRKERLY